MTSLTSANGPSVTLALPPGNVTRAPIEGGCSPSRANSTPAFCNDSLYFIIAATAFASGTVPGFALSYPFGIIIIMNRMDVSPYDLGGVRAGGRIWTSVYSRDDRATVRSTRPTIFFGPGKHLCEMTVLRQYGGESAPRGGKCEGVL